MMPTLRLVVVLVACAPLWTPTLAQSNVSADSGVAAYRDSLVALRDTVTALSAATVRLRRYLSNAGDETIIDGAHRLQRRCTGTRDAFGDARPFLRAIPGGERTRAAARRLDLAMADLVDELARTCFQGLAADGPGLRADSLRAHGPSRIATLDRAVNAYNRAVTAYTRAAGFQLPPKRP